MDDLQDIQDFDVIEVNGKSTIVKSDTQIKGTKIIVEEKPLPRRSSVSLFLNYCLNQT